MTKSNVNKSQVKKKKLCKKNIRKTITTTRAQKIRQVKKYLKRKKEINML